MGQVNIYQTERYTVTSYGSGDAYCLRDRIAKRELFVQGDEADQFRAELDVSIEVRGINAGLSFIVGEYAEVMIEDEA